MKGYLARANAALAKTEHLSETPHIHELKTQIDRLLAACEAAYEGYELGNTLRWPELVQEAIARTKGEQP